MSAEKLGTRYAKSLFMEATNKAALDTVFADLNLLQNTLNSSRDLRAVFNSPVIKSYKKEAITKQIFSGKINPITENFLQVVIQQGRDAFLKDIIVAYTKMYNEKNGISEVNVTTAIPLDTASEQKIADFIKATSGNPNVKINKKVDAAIAGGFIVDFGGKIYDNSVRYKLNKIKKEISLN